MVKTQPLPERLRTCSSPPLASTLRRLMDSPSPSPDRSVLRERTEQIFGLPRGESAALIREAKQGGKLLQEQRNPASELRFGGARRRPLFDFRAATLDQLFAVRGSR